jgi:hypothetical protein
MSLASAVAEIKGHVQSLARRYGAGGMIEPKDAENDLAAVAVMLQAAVEAGESQRAEPVSLKPLVAAVLDVASHADGLCEVYPSGDVDGTTVCADLHGIAVALRAVAKAAEVIV